MKKTIGKFITIEGCEGVGKSAQTRYLREYCEKNGIEAVFTREPGGTESAEKIRNLILDSSNSGLDGVAELMLYGASRRVHVKELIEPALKAGKTVFCDRFTDSTLAYQGYGRGVDKAVIETLNGAASEGAEIYLTLFLDVDPVTGFARKGGANPDDRLERENAEFFKRVYAGFKELAARYPQRIVSIDASGTKYETHDKIVEILKSRNVL
jgi:dTMP kinase